MRDSYGAGVVWVSKKEPRRHKGRVLIGLGTVLIAAALCMTEYNLIDDGQAARSAMSAVGELERRMGSSGIGTADVQPSGNAASRPATVPGVELSDAATSGRLPESSTAPEAASGDAAASQQTGCGHSALILATAVPDYALNPDMEMPRERVEDADYIGILRIPAMNLELPVAAEWSYKVLKKTPCRYSGTAYQENLIICAHNYSSHFGRLRSLKEGDIATLTDMDGNMFTYRLALCEILAPNAVADMKDGGWALTLFTCTVGGESRVTARFELAD